MIETELTDGVYTITVSRPEALNALSPDIIEQLREVILAIQERLGVGTPDSDAGDTDWGIRGVVITGEGDKSFVAGADIGAMQQMDSATAAEYAELADELTEWIAELPVPVFAAVNGYALGGGLELAMACDVIYASENAIFGQPEVALGVIPGFGGCVRLQRFIGAAGARELILTGKKINAQEALRRGLVAAVYESPEAVRQAATDAVKALSANSPLAIAKAKEVIAKVSLLETHEALAAERAGFADCFDTEDQKEGMAAFLAKRKANFTGK